MFTPIFLCVVLVGLTAAAACVRRIPEGQAYTLRRVGGHMRTVGAGTHLIVPLVERIAHRIRLLGNVATLGQITSPSGQCYSAQVFYQVLDAGRADAVIDHVDGLLREQMPALIDHAQTSNADDRGAQVKAELNRVLRDRGILITRVQIAGA